MRISMRGFAALLSISILLVCSTSRADHIPDLGIPDSAYFGSPTFQMRNCSGEVEVTIPIYLYSDSYSILNIFYFYWYGDAACDTVLIFATGGTDTIIKEVHIHNDVQYFTGSSAWPYSYICPTNGTELFLKMQFTAVLGDSFTIEVDSARFNFRDFNDYWFPMYRPLNLSVHLPDTLAMMPGDADCSGTVNVSDVVYLISYIFSEGDPPYDSNAGDANGDCMVNISDVVYEILYIFSGGDPPLPGCVW